MTDKTFGEIVKEYSPNATKEEVDYILWEQTGFPFFWNIPEDGDSPEACLRKQLIEFQQRQYTKR